eukprot:1156803-Pelagomonas_calceolata.AAC.3
MSNLVLMSKSMHAGHAYQARFERFLGSIVQVDVFVKHHPKVLEGAIHHGKQAKGAELYHPDSDCLNYVQPNGA